MASASAGRSCRQCRAPGPAGVQAFQVNASKLALRRRIETAARLQQTGEMFDTDVCDGVGLLLSFSV